MGCCNPHYREHVIEQEKKVNEKGKDSLPQFIKFTIMIVVLAGGLLAL